MDVRATTKYLPISPQKIRLVCDVVRGMNTLAAADMLSHMPQKGAGMILKTLRSAMANAENNFELNPAEMVISEIYANDGPFKPWIRRTSHLTVVLSERVAEEAAPEGAPDSRRAEEK